MPDARAIQVCDAVVTAIAAALPVGDTTTVERVYLPDISAKSITGRKVFVWPIDYGQAGTVSRGQDLNEYGVGVLVVERDTTARDPAGSAARSWIDERVTWVQTQVFDLLSDARTSGLPAALAAVGVWPESGEVASVYDPEMLRELKLFWSESAFAFRRDE